jgi:PD-(D/E)XK nuclease superfamily
MTATKPKLQLDFLKSHTVYRNAKGERVPGVTTVLGMLNKPALIKWAWDLGRQGIDLEAAREKAADIGTIAHGLCEAYLRGMELDRTNLAPDMLDRAETSFLKFLQWWDRQHLVVERTEQAMVSERLQVGGTLDILARSESDLVLVDLKSGNAIYDEALVQAAVYAAMWEETHAERVEQVFVVRISKVDTHDLEVREVHNRLARVAAFAALAEARRLLVGAGVRV